MADGTEPPVPQTRFRNDEPTAVDGLDRLRYAHALARLALDCETPTVIGLYGGWGTGKSSLMLQIRAELEARVDGDYRTVWFDPWRHQFDENPVVALLQKMVSDLRKDLAENLKADVKAVAAALLSPLLKATVGLKFDELQKLTDQAADEQYRIREEQIVLRERIAALVAKVLPQGAPVVFFIDDLDRCLPKTMVRVLEALKLYLNLANCVYFVGIDHVRAMKAIETEFAGLPVSEHDYLDKIVQIPFLLPPIHGDRATDYIAGLLPDAATGLAGTLAPLIGDNPRRVKRFTNVLSLNLALAPEVFGGDEFDVELIAAFLMIQHRREGLFHRIVSDPTLFERLRAPGDGTPETADDDFGNDTALRRMVRELDIDPGTPLDKYLHLADVGGAAVRRDVAGAVEPEMVELPAGEFMMGASDNDKDATDAEKPAREVSVGRFALGRYPVTFDEYDRFAAATVRPEPDDNGWGRGRRPVINVSWEDATAYAEWLAKETGKPYRLPSEAEWEYACRACTTTRFAVGDDLTPEDANFGDHVGRTTDVGTYGANAFGLHDMHGNVWEWVEDAWHDSYEGEPPTDGSAWTEGRDPSVSVVRGGSWGNRPGYCRSSSRFETYSRARNEHLGFRIARTF